MCSDTKLFTLGLDHAKQKHFKQQFPEMLTSKGFPVSKFYALYLTSICQTVLCLDINLPRYLPTIRLSGRHVDLCMKLKVCNLQFSNPFLSSALQHYFRRNIKSMQNFFLGIKVFIFPSFFHLDCSHNQDFEKFLDRR